MAAKKSNKSKKSSPKPAETKLNLVALKPKDKQPEPQPEPVQQIVEPPAPIEQTAAPVAVPKEPPFTTPDQSASEAQGQEEPIPNTNTIFQAIGIIVATINFNDNNQTQVTISDKQYPLFYKASRKNSHKALKEEIEATGQKQQRLIVYPKVMHFPSQEQPYQIAFSLVNFDNPTRSCGTARELEDFQFKLSGLWQFIPGCSIPCISVFKNFDSARLSYMKKATPQQRVHFFKPVHVPVIWNDAPIQPFRFNPDLDKKQRGHASFVEIMAQFLPEKDAFAFTQLRSQPSQSAPRFLSVSKKDKALARQSLSSTKTLT